MSKLLSPGQYRIAIQICAMSAVAALMSGCSSDSTRFGDAFGNPFATGSTAKPQKTSSLKRPVGTGRTPPVVASALPPHGTAVASAAPVRSAPVAMSHETTGSIGSARNVPGSSFGGWSGQGGASVQVAQGDTAAVLAQRYGVPENVLLQVNGLHAAGEIQPGATIVVPVYNAVASASGAAPRMAQAAPAPLVHPVSRHVAAIESPAPRVAAVEPARQAAVKAVPVHLAKGERSPARVAGTEPVSPAHKGKVVTMAPVKAAAVQVHVSKVAAVAVAAPHPAPKLKPVAVAVVTKPVAAPVKTAPVKVAASPAPAKVAVATPAAKPVPAKVAASAAKPEQVAAVETKKAVDDTPTASVPPAATAAAATPATDGPEFRWPARGRIIQGFKGGAGGNDGINIAVPEGTQVKAAEGGVVAYAGSELKGYGNLVLIRHPNGYVTAYANNGEIDVKRGETVKRGQMIAKSGQSGNVSSPQLHFELRKGAQPVDPTSYLAGL